MEKQCNCCERMLPLAMFNKNKAMKDGYGYYCRDCRREKKKAWKQNHRESYLESKRREKKARYARDMADPVKHKELKQQGRIRYQQNKERLLPKYRERSLNYVRSHKEEHNERNRNYAHTERGRTVSRNNGNKRRAMKRQNGVEKIATALLEQLYTGGICPYCQAPLVEGRMHLDHIVPIKKGGAHTLNNLVVCCDTCNISKRDRDLAVFLKEKTPHPMINGTVESVLRYRKQACGL